MDPQGSARAAGLRYVTDAAPGIARHPAGPGFRYRAAGGSAIRGRATLGRKQYRYHARWREVRDETKYGRMAAFAKALPRIRRRVRADLALAGLPRDKVLATVVRLLETTRMRVGNEEYARANDSFGLP